MSHWDDTQGAPQRYPNRTVAIVLICTKISSTRYVTHFNYVLNYYQLTHPLLALYTYFWINKFFDFQEMLIDDRANAIFCDF